MVECRRQLNHCLQEALLRLSQSAPDVFPMLVSLEELASPVAGEAQRKRSLIPVKRHASSISDPCVFDVSLHSWWTYCGPREVAVVCWF